MPLYLDSRPGLFFMSGDWFDTTERKWERGSFPRPQLAFNLAVVDGRPTILGLAHQNGTCGSQVGGAGHLRPSMYHRPM